MCNGQVPCFASSDADARNHAPACASASAKTARVPCARGYMDHHLNRSPFSKQSHPIPSTGPTTRRHLPGSGCRSIFPSENAAAYLQLRTGSWDRGTLGGDTPPHTHIHPPFGCEKTGFRMASSGGPCVAALLSWSLHTFRVFSP